MANDKIIKNEEFFQRVGDIIGRASKFLLMFEETDEKQQKYQMECFKMDKGYIEYYIKGNYNYETTRHLMLARKSLIGINEVLKNYSKESLKLAFVMMMNAVIEDTRREEASRQTLGIS